MRVKEGLADCRRVDGVEKLFAHDAVDLTEKQLTSFKKLSVFLSLPPFAHNIGILEVRIIEQQIVLPMFKSLRHNISSAEMGVPKDCMKI